MKVRFYLAPQQGIGTFLNPYRSILNDLIDIQAGDWFDEIDNPARHISICCVHASDTSHAAILANAQVIPVSPLFASEANIPVGLETVLNSIPGIATIKTKLEANGINMAWISGSNTLKDAIRYLFKTHAIAQIADGEGKSEVKQLITNNLDTTVNQVPQAIRTAIKNWMQAKGLAIGWITNATTVREILHFIVSNLGIGKLRMSGEDF